MQPQSIRVGDDETLKALFGVSETFVRDLEKAGKLKLYRPSRTVTLVRCDDLLEVLCPRGKG